VPFAGAFPAGLKASDVSLQFQVNPEQIRENGRWTHTGDTAAICGHAARPQRNGRATMLGGRQQRPNVSAELSSL
jgi:hypothetical protein